MLFSLRAAGLLWPTVLSLTALLVLVSLGNWQMSRKAWKDGLEARIAERVEAAPAELGSILATSRAGADLEYVRVEAKGRYLHDRELYLYAPHPRLGPGFHVFTPLEIEGGRVLLVNRGYVTEALRDRSRRAAGLVEGMATVTGLVRLPAVRGAFTPDNDARSNLWYWRHLQGMISAAFPEGGRPAVPFFLDAEAEPPQPGGWPRGGVTELKLSNRHLEYALTWYGLAATLVGVYAAFAFGRLRAQRAS